MGAVGSSMVRSATFLVTVTFRVAFLPEPSEAVKVIFTLPAFRKVTTPSWVISAMDLLLTDQVPLWTASTG